MAVDRDKGWRRSTRSGGGPVVAGDEPAGGKAKPWEFGSGHRQAARGDDEPRSRPPDRRPGRRSKPPPAFRARTDTSIDGPVRIWGVHAVEAALGNPAREITRIFATDNGEMRLQRVMGSRTEGRDGGPTLPPIEPVTPRDLDRLLGADTVHQGVLIEAVPLAEPSLAELIAAADGKPFVVLDQVTDPHNVGAILRSAAAFGAAGLVTTRRNSPPLSGVLAKAASGALEHVGVALVPNLARALAELGEAGIVVIGLDGDGDPGLEEAACLPGVAIVLGAEGKGLRHLTKQHCDRVCRIETPGSLTSLNVSNAAAVALHIASLQRRRTRSAEPS